MAFPFEHEVTVAKIAMVPISHLFILPAAFFAYLLGLYDVVIGIMCIYGISQMYHFVEARAFAVEDIYMLWVGDYVCIFLLGLIIEMVIFELKIEQRYYIVLPTVLVTIILGKLFHDTALLFVLLGMYFVEFLLIHKLHMAQKYGVGVLEIHIVNIVVYGFLLLMAADGIFFLYWAGNPGDRYYFWRHVAGWHIPIFSAASFLMGFTYFERRSKSAIKKNDPEAPPAPATQPNVPVNWIVKSGLPDPPATLTNRSYGTYGTYDPDYYGL